MSVYLGNTLISGVGRHTESNAHTLLDFKWSDHIINSMEWLRSDTFSWQSGGVYQAVYNHLVADLVDATPYVETVGDYSLTVYTATDGHKIVLDDEESTVINIFNSTGVAWYYIVDTTNTRFKLPRSKPLSDGVKGSGITLGITDGTHNDGICWNSSVGVSATTTSYGKSVGTNISGTPSTVTHDRSLGITTDATKSGIIVERNNDSQYKYLYFYVGQYTQSAIEQTAGITSEELNGKLETDLGNATQQAKETIISYGIPDYKNGTNISFPYTATKSGVIHINWHTRTATKCQVDYTRNSTMHQYDSGYGTNYYNTLVMIIENGDVITEYTENAIIDSRIFYPFKGLAS